MLSVIEDTGVLACRDGCVSILGKSYDYLEIDVSFAEKEKKRIEQRALCIST